MCMAGSGIALQTTFNIFNLRTTVLFFACEAQQAGEVLGSDSICTNEVASAKRERQEEREASKQAFVLI